MLSWALWYANLPNAQKPAPRRDRLSCSVTCDRKGSQTLPVEMRSELAIGEVGCLSGGVLACLLGIAHGLLRVALAFLDQAFALQLLGANGLADALFGLADGFVG